MRIRLERLEVVARQATERIDFTDVTFLHGPVGTGKSTVARLIDFCFGGELVETPALQSEFVAARLFTLISSRRVILERDASAAGTVRVTWEGPHPDAGEQEIPRTSVLAPLQAEKGVALLDGVVGVENLSDLLFYLADTAPIRVRQNRRDPDAKLVRLGFRDLLFYCYLDQDGLDSSFFAFDHPFKRQKSADAMRFIVGFHSERLNELEQRLYRALEEQRTKRAMVTQLEQVLKELDFASEMEIAVRLDQVRVDRRKLQDELSAVEVARRAKSHPLDQLRSQLRELSARLTNEEEALDRLRERLAKREALRAELLTAKVKALRADAAQRVIAQVVFERCPQCETPTAPERHAAGHCSLCGEVPTSTAAYEELASEFDARIDDLEDLIRRHTREAASQEVRVTDLHATKQRIDADLDAQARSYDGAFIARLRELERLIAELGEREKNLIQLQRVPATAARLIKEAGELQGEVDSARKGVEQETQRLRSAQTVVQSIQAEFKSLLLRVGFPGMSTEHEVKIDTTNWEPRVFSGQAAWGFDELGSGGKKVLFKVLYALALHEVAAKNGLPLPTFLIVDSPTKNISHDVNPELFEAFYREVYRVARAYAGIRQFILIDSELVKPIDDLDGFSERLLDHSKENPPLISYYSGM